MTISQLALVSETQGISLANISPISAALQKQITRDLAPIWNVQATVDSFESLESVPSGYWKIVLTDKLKPSQGDGIHEDHNGQPFALVRARQGWSLSASHEALEMLVDPSGQRMVSGQSPLPEQGRVDFLVEICDPCEAPDFAYCVNGISVSDFVTPNYYDPVANNSVRYSFRGAIKMPRQVLKDGYLSWHDPVTDHLWRESFFGDSPDFIDLGPHEATPGENLRSVIYSRTPEAYATRFPNEESLRKSTACLEAVNAAARSKAKRLRQQISKFSKTSEEE